ncbi:MAG: cupin domain-containing protein [Nannocystaceae bacterium]
MSERTPPASQQVVRAADLGRGDELHVRHPRNPASDIYMTRLSDRAGLTHLGVSRARVPPGKESFILHAHTIQEEWVYVLDGRGEVVIGDETLAIGPGDFIGFPPGGAAHVLRNRGDVDLVFLQGGDRRPGDRGLFPSIGKIGFERGDGHMALIDEAAVELLPFSAWVADD